MIKFANQQQYSVSVDSLIFVYDSPSVLLSFLPRSIPRKYRNSKEASQRNYIQKTFKISMIKLNFLNSKNKKKKMN